ncbi:hypothetical protein ATN89_21520 [Comamonas thiooxydans]|nr:hypothetical protein ATN89_21520 [Comamonas thiooxydans]
MIDLYRKNANSNGTLGIDPNDHKFTFNLESYVAKEEDFIDFTKKTVDLIKGQMEQAFMSTGGYALFLRYTADNHDLMMIAMLKLKEGSGIDATTLDITETLNIDMNRLHEAARINITRWQNGEEPHLTFIKGRGSKGVSDYFRNALACTAFTNSKYHTELVILAADAFIDKNTDIPPEEKTAKRIEMRRSLYGCLSKVSDEVPLITVAAAVNPDHPEAFVEFIQQRADSDGFHIDGQFKPYKPAVKGLQRLAARYGSIHVSFDVDDVQHERVRYDEESDSIILKNPPSHIVRSVRENEPTE